MQFLTLALALATAISASPILRRDQFPAIPTVDQASNRVVLVAGTASDLTKRDLAVPVVDVTSGHVTEHEGATAALRARDEFPAIPTVDQASNRVVLVTGSASDLTKRDLAVPVIDVTSGHVTEHEGATTNDKRDAGSLGGVIPVVVDAGRVVAVPMTAENTSS